MKRTSGIYKIESKIKPNRIYTEEHKQKLKDAWIKRKFNQETLKITV